MILAFFSLFPCIVCAVWTVVFLLRRQPNAAQRAFALLAFGGAMFFFLDANLLNHKEVTPIYKTLDAVLHYFSLTTPAFMLMALRTLAGTYRDWKFMKHWLLIPIPVLFFELLFIAWRDCDADTIHIYRYVFFLILAIFDTIFCLLLAFELYKLNFSWTKFFAFFFARGKSPSPSVVGVCFIAFLIPLTVKTCLGDDIFSHMPVLSSILYFILGLMLLIVASAAYVSHFPKLTLASIFNPNVLIGEHDLSEAEEILDPLPNAEAEIPISEVPLGQKEMLLDKLKKAMEEGKLYLNPSLSIDALALHLGTNRLYISRLVNTTYHCNFRDYINGLRIEYAKEYMLQYPSATQEVIAVACGFSSAQAFNHKFRQLENCSPRQWIEQNRRQENENEN